MRNAQPSARIDHKDEAPLDPDLIYAHYVPITVKPEVKIPVPSTSLKTLVEAIDDLEYDPENPPTDKGNPDGELVRAMCDEMSDEIDRKIKKTQAAKNRQHITPCCKRDHNRDGNCDRHPSITSKMRNRKRH